MQGLITAATSGFSTNQITNNTNGTLIRTNEDGTVTVKLDSIDQSVYLDPNTERMVIQPANGLEIMGNAYCSTAPTDNTQLANKLYVDTAVSNIPGGSSDRIVSEPLGKCSIVASDSDILFSVNETPFFVVSELPNVTPTVGLCQGELVFSNKIKYLGNGTVPINEPEILTDKNYVDTQVATKASTTYVDT